VNSELKSSIEQDAVNLFSSAPEIKQVSRLPIKEMKREAKPEIDDFHSAVDLD